MGYMRAAFTTLSWIDVSSSELERNSFRSKNVTHPAPKPIITKNPMDFPRVSVAETVLIKPKPTITIAQPTHICGRYRLVAVIDSPVMRPEGTIDENASK